MRAGRPSATPIGIGAVSFVRSHRRFRSKPACRIVGIHLGEASTHERLAGRHHRGIGRLNEAIQAVVPSRMHDLWDGRFDTMAAVLGASSLAAIPALRRRPAPS